jgi:hypothetical protein
MTSFQYLPNINAPATGISMAQNCLFHVLSIQETFSLMSIAATVTGNHALYA